MKAVSLLSCLFLPLLANGLHLGLPPARVARRTTSPSLFFDLKKMIDPENAMERGVLADELSGGDGSEESLAQAADEAKTNLHIENHTPPVPSVAALQDACAAPPRKGRPELCEGRRDASHTAS